MERFFNWMDGPAEWYQFWRPGSGVLGGIVLGIVVLIGIFLLIYTTGWR